MTESAGFARPPGNSRLLSLYSRYVPAAARAAIKERLPVKVRVRIASRLTGGGAAARLADRITLSRARAAHPEIAGRADRTVVRLPQGTFVARVERAANSADVRRDTVRFVLDALTAAGVPAFRVRCYGSVRTAVGVPAVDLDRAADALVRASAGQPTYVGQLKGRRVGSLSPAGEAATWRRLAGAKLLRVVQFVADPSGRLVLGAAHGCDIEVWTEVAGVLRAPRPNRVADEIPVEGGYVDAPEALFTRYRVTGTSRTREEFTGLLLDDIDFPVDVVYTWVDGDDPGWRQRRDQALRELTGVLNDQAANESRYANRDELRYSLRSLHQYAPWVNHIWLVTDDQVPAWLDTAHPRVTVVSHRELFGGSGRLPSFNSHAIESQLHRIAGLTEHFLYFNDDVMFGRPVTPHLFFHANGVTKFFPSTAKIDTSAASLLDAPVTAAGKNNRTLVRDAFGRTVTYKMKHCPHALRRSVLAEIGERFGDAVAGTAGNQFRDVADVSIPSALYHYYAHAQGQATIGEVRYMYTDLADPDTAHRLRLALARRDYDVLCLNDTETLPDRLQHDALTEFLEAYYPVPAPWEGAPRPPHQQIRRTITTTDAGTLVPAS